MTPDWITIFGATGAWAGVLYAAMYGLHRRRRSAILRIETLINNLDDKIDTVAAAAAKEHTAIRVQVRDMEMTLVDLYVRRAEFERTMGDLHSVLTDMRKESGEDRNRIFAMLQQRGGRGGS